MSEKEKRERVNELPENKKERENEKKRAQRLYF
jgi:hypothetical protein